MKTLKYAIYVLLFTFLCSAFVKAEPEVKFYVNEYSKAVRMAKKENKLVFIMFTADYCGVCKQMEKQVFNKKKVGNFFNKNFVSVQIIPNSTMRNMKASNYGVKKLPTFIFLDEKKNELLRREGFREIDEIIEDGKIALKKEKRGC